MSALQDAAGMTGAEGLTTGTVRARLAVDQPGRNPQPILHAVRDFASWRGDTSLDQPPLRDEVEEYLLERSLEIGAPYAFANLSNLQAAAPVIWGVGHAAILGLLLRQNRCSAKQPATDREAAAMAAISRLPEAWRAGLVACLSSAPGARREKWSTSHVEAVAHALSQWFCWCLDFGRDPAPNGLAFHAYVEDLLQDGVSLRSAADYLSRILSGYSVAVQPGFQSRGCDHVIAATGALAKLAGSPTKTGDQIVGASTIYALGMDLVAAARELGPRGLSVARDFRNGLLLATAVSLPQRARALSHLAYDTTLSLPEGPLIHVTLPGSALKQREYMKEGAGYDRVFPNPELWSALDDYRRTYRPLFDDGAALFPSVHDMGAAISSVQIGRLVGNLTEKHLGVRISIHRVRDNVATEAAEELRSGGYLAPALLGHTNAATTMKSYDHAEGVRAARDYAVFLDTKRSMRTSLRL